MWVYVFTVSIAVCKRGYVRNGLAHDESEELYTTHWITTQPLKHNLTTYEFTNYKSLTWLVSEFRLEICSLSIIFSVGVMKYECPALKSQQTPTHPAPPVTLWGYKFSACKLNSPPSLGYKFSPRTNTPSKYFSCYIILKCKFWMHSIPILVHIEFYMICIHGKD